jgi:hypothetical protein
MLTQMRLVVKRLVHEQISGRRLDVMGSKREYY